MRQKGGGVAALIAFCVGHFENALLIQVSFAFWWNFTWLYFNGLFGNLSDILDALGNF